MEYRLPQIGVIDIFNELHVISLIEKKYTVNWENITVI